jgi:hypothetical protein
VTGRAPSAGELFRDELLGALPVEGRRAAQTVLNRWAGQSVRVPAASAAERQRRRDVAALLLRSGLSRAEATEIIVARFHVSERHARRIVTSGQDSQHDVRSVADTEPS